MEVGGQREADGFLAHNEVKRYVWKHVVLFTFVFSLQWS